MQVTAATGRRRRRIGPVLLLALSCCGAAWAEGGETRADRSRGEPQRTTAQWLQAIQSAAQRLNYVGTIVYQRGSAVQASRIVHASDGGVSYERLQVLDGRRREYIRRDGEVQCLDPERKLIRLERRFEQDSFPALGSGAPTEILAHYKMTVGGIERVADYECRVLVLEPVDALRHGHWLCAERYTALLLKARTLNPAGEPLEQMAFADLRLGERIDRSQFKPTWTTDGWTVERSDAQPADFDRSPWQLTVPAGFRRLRAVARQMDAGDQQRQTLQVVYSDGLATLSVFIEPGAGNLILHDITQTQGPVTGYTRRVGEALVTVIGEVPPATARSVALSVAPTGSAADAPAPR